MKYFFLLILTAVSLTASAQKYGLAVKIGGGIADQYVQSKYVISANSIRTLNFGVVSRYYLPKSFMLQLGAGIANKGAVITEDAITTTQHITYLDVPLNIVRKFGFPGLGIVYFGAGGYASMALRGKNNFETPNSITSEKLAFSKLGDLQKFDDGLNLTAGLELNNKLLFDLRYAYGLKNLTTDPLRDTGTAAIKNRLVTISLGYVFK